MLTSESFYHIYNRGNNREPIFFQLRNYNYFLDKVKKHFLTHVNILAYCLMPNHFHFLVYSKEDIVSESFSNDLKIMLRSYTRAINKQEGRIGSLFAQNTKIKSLEEGSHAMTPSHGMTDYPSKPYEGRAREKNGRLRDELILGLCRIKKQYVM